MEEAKAIVCWEGIRDQIRLEDHRRGEVTNDPQEKKTPLENLSDEDLVILKVCSQMCYKEPFKSCNFKIDVGCFFIILHWIYRV